ncbi:GIY-YIG nuclease family protein [candidate division WWE3 bacterium]|nr:GIY-YIG nuclease family protein [candidate division WWE3 bacterium]
MYTVYVLKLTEKKRWYVGVTGNIARRLKEHRCGMVKSTKGRFDGLVYTERFDVKSEAWKREKWLKSGQGREWLEEKLNL